MNTWEQLLLGELIGLARATDGNEHLITDELTGIIQEILTESIQNASQYLKFSGKIKSAKEKIVPDCFHCANPCGRTDAFDMRTLELESIQIQQTKLSVLEELRILAASEMTSDMERKLYRGLVLIGLTGYTSEELISLFAGSE